MRKADKRPHFKPNSKLASREAKIAALNAINTPESRKERKQMNVHWHGKLVATNVRGMYAGRKGNGSHPVKVRINAKNRRHLSNAKAIMRGTI